MLNRLLGPLAVTALLFGLTACGSDDGNTATDGNAPSTPPASTDASSDPAATTPPSESPSEATTSSPAAADGTCTYSPDGQQPAKKVNPPTNEPTVKGDVAVTIKTSVGPVKATLDATAAPCTVNSFVSLADQGYYDGTPCHRITTTPGFEVLQCGDPTGTGGGGPGYGYADELKGDEVYPAGTLAMANAGPNTNGSQFFIVYGDTNLPPAYTVFGTVDAPGLKAIKKVARDGSTPEGDGAPNTPIKLTKVTVST